MDGLFIIIAIFIGLANFAAKQQKNQGNRSRQQHPDSRNPVHRKKYIPESLKKTIMDLENAWSEGLKGTIEDQPAYLSVGDEGTESEDRRQMGSLEYIERTQSSEGECDEHPEHYQEKRREKDGFHVAETVEDMEDNLFNLTEENLLKSIVMAEILGPPRAIKRRIR